jgi:hypothetical protein
MIAISVRQYPTTSWDGQAKRELSVGDVGLSVPWSRLVQFATMRTPVTRGFAEVESKLVAERQRCANPQPDDARALRAVGSGGVSLAARRD